MSQSNTVVTSNKQTKTIKIVIVGHRHLGDTIFIEPLVRCLAEFQPTVIVKSQAAQSILEQFSHQPKSIVCENFKSLKIALKSLNADVCIILDKAFGSAMTARIAKVPIRIGQAWEGRGFLLTHKIPKGKKQHHMHGHLHAIHILEQVLGQKLANHAYPSLIPPKHNAPKTLIQREYIVIHTNTTRPSKEFTKTVYANIATYLRQCGMLSVITGTEDGYKHSLGSLADVDMINALSFPDFCGLLANAKAVISPDTGPMHLAAGYGVPTFGIFGATSPNLTGPKGKQVHVLKSEARCSPCFKYSCKYKEETKEYKHCYDWEKIKALLNEGLGLSH